MSDRKIRFQRELKRRAALFERPPWMHEYFDVESAVRLLRRVDRKNRVYVADELKKRAAEVGA